MIQHKLWTVLRCLQPSNHGPGPACVKWIIFGMMHFVVLQHRQLCYCTRQFHALDPPGAEFVLASTETAEGQHCAALVVYGDAAPDTSCAPGQSPLCKCRQVGSVLVDRMASLLAPATEAGHQKTWNVFKKQDVHDLQARKNIVHCF